jgi:hypothetical protein
MSTLDPLIDIPVTQYYFDTFIVGAHHSVPHLISDLSRRKDIASFYIDKDIPFYRKMELEKLCKMIDTHLSSIDPNSIGNIEDAEPTYWIHKLGRQSALEISTYGRIRPETMDLLMCLEEEHYVAAMSVAGRLSSKIQEIGDRGLATQSPIPSSIPIIS